MTALQEASPRTRLRHAVETAPGGRVLVAVDDLRALLAGRDEAPQDLDVLTGWPSRSARVLGPWMSPHTAAACHAVLDAARRTLARLAELGERPWDRPEEVR